MTARAVMIFASVSGMCGVVAFVLFFHKFCASDCGSWRFSYIVLPALTETLFFSSIDCFFSVVSLFAQNKCKMAGISLVQITI